MTRKRSVLAVIISICLFAGLFFGVRQYLHPAFDFATGTPGADVVVAIPTGATGADMAHILAKEKVIKTWQAFFKRASIDPRAMKIQPGSHRISTHLTAKNALEQLLDRGRMVGLINITEGMRSSEILKILRKAGWTLADLTSAYANARPPVGYSSPTAEGYLFPASYSFAKEVSALKVFQTMMDRFRKEATSLNIVEGAKTLRLTPAQIVTVASLVQGEGDPADFSKIARVILNRLADGMNLQLDTTILYALKVTGRIRVTNSELHVASRCNTYKYPGLPPGPIDSPGQKALTAALNPAIGSWLFFVTVKPGDTRFTSSESQFFKWKAEYERNYRAGAFKP
jgi:UPF0755 protein